ncbi:MAG: cobalt-precorrin-5B (C(1))-methyltransferase CbiD [Synechococcales bacterium]|nr:cobalt-precorrin-5B (C(1))-methyltransferase CbiD [Synechococcales bacterium]
MARTGYTLPVFAVAAAQAALQHLLQRRLLPSPSQKPIQQVILELLPDRATIAIQQVAQLDEQTALAITLSDPGDNLDLTRHTPIWAKVCLQPRSRQPEPSEALILQAGEGLGRSLSGEPAIYQYAQRLFDANLRSLIPEDQTAIVTIILPEGKQLAERTSNAAFGIVEGLSLLGTSGIAKPLSAEEHLSDLRQALQQTVHHHSDLIFCIGSNGMQVAARLGWNPEAIVQTGNWIGAMLVDAGLQGATSVRLLGYQGKLIKLAGGIFNTSSHLADAKLEILSAAVLRVGGSAELARSLLACKTADAAYHQLVEQQFATPVFTDLTHRITQNAQAYVKKYANVPLPIQTILFDRQGTLIAPNPELMIDG